MNPNPGMVLIVEDDASVNKALSRAFRSMGCDVCAFQSGEVLLASEVTQDPALLLLDLHLPGKSGAELITELGLRAPGLRIVVMTGRDLAGARESCLAAGASSYLKKPISRSDLAALLES